MKNKKWTLENLPDLTGKNILITGANSGLGFEAGKALAGAGAEVIMACRSMEKGLEARKKILADHPNARIEVMELDLMDLESIGKLATEVRNRYRKLDVLLNNAGIMMTPYHQTKDGFESQVGTNHLGHFALTGQLMELIRQTPGARVVTVSSIAHKRGDMDLNNLLFENGKHYTPIRAYGRSKLANLLFTYELQRFFEKNGIDAISVAAHPGVAMTNLMRYLGNKRMVDAVSFLFGWMIPSARKGALPEIRAAADPTVRGGEYYGPDGFNEMSGYPVKVKSVPLSHDREVAEKLWDISEKLTRVSFK
jgi:NAD(P)-dependent dehydrogenase (short-subunit alcohol dehydrogenase family)